MQNCYSGSPSKKAAAGEQNERLTTKHIHTLKFLQEIVAENNELKERLINVEGKDCRCQDMEKFIEENQNRIKQIQEEYLKRADEINHMLTEKHKAEMMKKVEQQLESEKAWAEEKRQLLAQIESLKKETEETKTQQRESMEQKSQIKIFELKVAALEQEIARLKESLDQTDGKNKAHLEQLKRMDFLNEQNRHLKEELTASTQKVQELEFKIRRLEKELSDAGHSEKDDILDTLKNRLAKMLKEKVAFEEREKLHVMRISDLSDENAKLRRALDDSERMRQDIGASLDKLAHELSILKRQTSAERDRQTFKEFVQVKRELVLVKEENENLRIKLKFAGGKRDSGVALPSLTAGDSKNSRQNRPGSGAGVLEQKRRESLTRK